MHQGLSFHAELDSLLPPHTPFNTDHHRLEESPAVSTRGFSLKKHILSIRNAAAALLAVWAADTAFILNKKVEQPEREDPRFSLVAYAHPSQNITADELPGPQADIEIIMHALDTDEKYEVFMKAHALHMLPITPPTFLQTYAESPEEFQENNWRGPCNTFAEFACEVGERHNKEMYLMAMWPSRPKSPFDARSVMEYKYGNAWHMVAFYKRHNRGTGTTRYVIFNNSDVHELNEGEMLEDWARSLGFSITQPLGGIVKWERVPRDWRAELGRHVFARTLAEEEVAATFTEKPATVLARR